MFINQSQNLHHKCTWIAQMVHFIRLPHSGDSLQGESSFLATSIYVLEQYNQLQLNL